MHSAFRIHSIIALALLLLIHLALSQAPGPVQSTPSTLSRIPRDTPNDSPTDSPTEPSTNDSPNNEPSTNDPPSTEPTTTDPTLLAITDDYLFALPLRTFVAARTSVLRRISSPSSADCPECALDWSSDDCTHAPEHPLGFDFRHACNRHDFGYRNYKAQGRLSGESRGRIDGRFWDDMRGVCNGDDGGGEDPEYEEDLEGERVEGRNVEGRDAEGMEGELGEMGLRKKTCLKVAKMYYEMVKDMGDLSA